MHDTARATGGLFFQTYGADAKRILDIGSMDVNGSLRPYAPPGAVYVGVDLEAGPGVDVVIKSHTLPFMDESFDAIVSTSCFEHDPCFWLTFLEATRLLTQDGALYISAPSNGPFHAYPLDCWRFYPDAGVALARYAGVELIESFIVPPMSDVWEDAVAVFGKGRRWPVPMAGRVPGCKHLRP